MREIRKIKVCESKRYNHSTNVLEEFCSIKIIDSQKKDPYFPVYPFSDLEHKAVLQEFVDLYEQELLEFSIKNLVGFITLLLFLVLLTTIKIPYMGLVVIWIYLWCHDLETVGLRKGWCFIER